MTACLHWNRQAAVTCLLVHATSSFQKAEESGNLVAKPEAVASGHFDQQMNTSPGHSLVMPAKRFRAWQCLC